MRKSLALLALLAPLVVGCGVLDRSGSADSAEPAPANTAQESSDTSEPKEPESKESESNESESNEPDSDGSGSEGSGSGQELGEPVQTRTSAETRAKLRLDIYEIVRADSVIHVNFAVTEIGNISETDTNFQVGQTFSDGDSSVADKTGFSVDGVQVIDAKNKKVHLPASDGNGQCLCSRDLAGAFIGLQQTMVFGATFAAPPDGVDKVDVVIPRFGTFTGVPVK
jgi:hypothetical protein